MDVNLKLPETIARRLLSNCINEIPLAKEKVDTAKRAFEDAQKEFDELITTRQTLEASLNGHTQKQSNTITAEDLEEIIGKSEPSTQKNEIGRWNTNFNKQWPILKKGMFILHQQGKRRLTTAEIVDSLIEQYEQEKRGDRSRFVGNMSSVLGMAEKEGKVTRAKNDLGENVWGLPNDFDPSKHFNPYQAVAISGFQFNEGWGPSK